MKKLLVVTVLIFAVLIVSIPQTFAQTIYACFNKSGAMRYATGSGMCKKTETGISWNTTGPAGPTGATGAQGPAGPQGPKGDPTYVSTVLVSPVGTATQNGTALLNALAGISTASSTNPYLLKIEPGIYDIGTSSLQMQQYVDVEGSGETTTIITGHIGSNTSGVVEGANNAEIRFLTVQNTGGGDSAIAVFNNSATTSFKMTNMTASASGGTYSLGVFNTSSSPTMTNVTASASGGTNNYGVFNTSSSPTMTNVTASASGGTTNYGVWNYLSSPTMTNMTASGSGGSNANFGVSNNSSSPTMTNMTASGSGGSNANFGVFNTSSSPTMTNVTVSGSGGTTNRGVQSMTSGTIRINHSVIKGSKSTVYNGSGVTTYVGNTQLDGAPAANAAGGTLTCAGVYDENYTFYASTCP